MLVRATPADVATRILVPVISILVALTFAWAGNAQAVLRTADFRRVARQHAGGIAEYVYSFQLCILVLLTTISAWSLVALGSPIIVAAPEGYILTTLLYAALSLSIRSSWQVVVGANLVLLTSIHIADKKTEGEDT